MQQRMATATASVISSQDQKHNFGLTGLILLLIIATLLVNGPIHAQTTAYIPAELVHYPDFVFYNGQVLTADADQDFTIAEAVAIRGNRIFSVGTSQQIQRLAGPNTRVIDLKGRSLTPGFALSSSTPNSPRTSR